MDTLLCHPTIPVLRRPLSPPLSSHVISHVNLGFLRPRRTKTQLRYSYQTKTKTTIICAGAVKEINETQFSEVVLGSDRPVLVEFVASWCGPCRLISPAVEYIAQEYKEKLTIVKIDHDANPSLIEEFKVYGLPTLILFRNGKAVPESRREGAITKVKLKAYVDDLLDSISVS